MNARSVVFGSEHTDARGKNLEHIFLRNNLSFLNIGAVPTCTASDRGSVIDITGITNTMEDIVNNWKVSKRDTNSDHKLIEFNIRALEPETKYKTTMTNEQKSNFMTELDDRLRKDIADLNPKTVNVMDLEGITDIVIKAFKDVEASNSTTREIRPPKRDLIWKDERVKEQNIIKNKAKYEYKAKPTIVNKNAMNREMKKLQKVMQKARTDIHRGNMGRIITQKDMSRLTKYAKNGKMREIGLTKNRDGNLATSPEEAISNLCDAHFPSAKNMQTETRNQHIAQAHTLHGTVMLKRHQWIRDDIIAKALKSFQNGKAPGLDGITPELLKLSGDRTRETLRLIFDMQITLGYTPSALRTSKVTFIGKVGKEDYTLPKSFRPISLTPFIFKLLERVSSWYIIHKTLKESPLNKRQHAYRTGKCTESAISQVLNQAEKGLLNRSYTLACFIDISSAFDRLDPTKAIEALIKKGVPTSIAHWYEDYLKNRYLNMTIKGITSTKSISIGCPQGGVLSTILWNVAFDNLLNIFTEGKVICVGYADDGSLLISHDNLPYL